MFMKDFKQPRLAVDIIIELEERGGKKRIVLIQRKNPPLGWALPGGFVEYGETLEAAAVREAREETSLDVKLRKQFHTYSDPKRDPRYHTVATVFLATASGYPKAADDAKEVELFTRENLPPLVFDHAEILSDYFSRKY